MKRRHRIRHVPKVGASAGHRFLVSSSIKLEPRTFSIQLVALGEYLIDEDAFKGNRTGWQLTFSVEARDPPILMAIKHVGHTVYDATLVPRGLEAAPCSLCGSAEAGLDAGFELLKFGAVDGADIEKGRSVCRNYIGLVGRRGKRRRAEKRW